MAGQLNPRQARFVEEYLVDLNATQAAMRAGYAPGSAPVAGARLIKNAKVQEAITAGMAARSRRTEVTADRVLREMARIGFSDLRRCFGPEGQLLRPEQWGDEAAPAIASVKVTTRPSGEVDENDNPIIEQVHELKLWDKPGALRDMAKHLGMFVDQHRYVDGDGKDVKMPDVVRWVGVRADDT